MSGIELLAGERKRHETGRAIQGCNDYLRLGAGRSMRVLWENYTKQDKLLPPTTTFQTIKTWSANYGWVKRAELFDAEVEQLKNARHEKIMRSGLALDHERVRELKKIANFLIDEIEKTGKIYRHVGGSDDERAGGGDNKVAGNGERFRVWLPDVKQIGSGEHAERVDIERYNSAIFSDLRGVFDDLAKETGGRIARHDIQSAGKELKAFTDEKRALLVNQLLDDTAKEGA